MAADAVGSFKHRYVVSAPVEFVCTAQAGDASAPHYYFFRFGRSGAFRLREQDTRASSGTYEIASRDHCR